MRNDLTYKGVTYDDDALREISAAVDTSLNERTLDVDTMQVVVQSSDATITNVSQSDPVAFLRGGSQYSLHYLQSVDHAGADFYLLNLTSPLGRLLQMAHRGGVYNGVAASTVIDEICGVVPHYVAPAFRNIRLYGFLPYVSPSGENGAQKGSAKDNLLQVLFAINATVRDDAQGVLRIENLSDSVSSQLTADRVFRGTTRVRHELPVTSVTVLEHQYIAGGQLTTLFEGTTTAGQIIVFSEPMSNLAATGFTITESNANYAVVSAGSGTLTGQAYIHTTREITRAVSSATIPNPVRIEGATLVGLTNSGEVVTRLADYYAHRTWIECEASIVYEDAGDVVEVWDALSQITRQACIELISPLRASNIMRGKISALVGFTPWQVVPFEDVREVLTGSGTWTVPEGVTQVTAVLIGGGGGGNGGGNGTSGDGSSGSWRFALGTISAPAGSGGSGGAGGAAGIAGRILRVEFTVTAGSSFGYSCAPGGAGGSAGGGAGGTSGDTRFGSSSSASGAISDAGYADPITGTTYALPAASGGDGAGGGAGGPVNSSAASNGYSGGSAGGYSGGAGGTGEYRTFGLNEVTARESSAGGGGGGASASRNGTNGSDATIESGVDKRGADGGRGANGASGSPGATYGCAGAGGNGGGGGGGAGSWYYWQKSSEGVFYVTYRAYGGSGGTGGAGGAGAPGCVILYYRRPVTT